MKLKKIQLFASKRNVVFLLILSIIAAGGAVYASKLFFSHLQSTPFRSYEPAEIITVDSDFQGEVLFNNRLGEKPFTDQLVALIRNAGYSIDVAMYSIDSPQLRDELYKAAQKNIPVRIALSSTKSEQHSALFANPPSGISFTSLGKEGNNLMHHKFLIVDAGKPSAAVVFGSFNWTLLQEAYDPSFMIVSFDKKITNAYEEEFGRLISGKSGPLKFNDPSYRPWASDIHYRNGELELWWSPGIGDNAIKKRMLDAIAEARSSIDIMIWQLTDRDIANALIAKARQGLRIRIITDDYNAYKGASVIGQLVKAAATFPNLTILDDASRNAEIQARTSTSDLPVQADFNSFFHHHALIIDRKVLITGTNNWSYQASYKNFESAVVTTVVPLVRSYEEAFVYFYKEFQAVTGKK